MCAVDARDKNRKKYRSIQYKYPVHQGHSGNIRAQISQSSYNHYQFYCLKHKIAIQNYLTEEAQRSQLHAPTSQPCVCIKTGKTVSNFKNNQEIGTLFALTLPGADVLQQALLWTYGHTHVLKREPNGIRRTV